MPDNVTLDMLYKNQVGLIIVVVLSLCLCVLLICLRYSELVRLNRENEELKQENEDLKRTNFHLLNYKIDRQNKDNIEFLQKIHKLFNDDKEVMDDDN